MKQKYNLALFGAGTIAKKIAEATEHNERLELYAVASRNAEHAVSFAEKYKIKKVYENYELMLADNAIDLVYISTPTKLHYEHIKQCLIAGKNVICEKPFVETVNQAIELRQLAKERNLLLIDALWTMYMPIMDKLKKAVNEIGKIKFLTASLGYPSILKDDSGNAKTRYDLWDYEVYPLATTIYLRGEPISLKSKSICKSDIIVKNRSFLKYKKGTSRIFSSLLHRSTYLLGVLGTKGVVIARKWWFGRFPVIIWKYPFKVEVMKFGHDINGYEYELNEAVNCLDKGLVESSIYPLSNTISVLKWAEQLDICR